MDVNVVTSILSVVVVPMMAAVTYLFHALRRANQRILAKERRVATLEMDLARTHAWIEARLGDDFGDALIVAEAANSMIVEWSPSSTVMFHWNQREMLGKSILTIIPQSYRERHLAAYSTWVSTDKSPRHGPFYIHGRTKEGHEIPVVIFLNGWHDVRTGRRMIAASIRPRREEDKGDSRKGMEVAGENLQGIGD